VLEHFAREREELARESDELLDQPRGPNLALPQPEPEPAPAPAPEQRQELVRLAGQRQSLRTDLDTLRADFDAFSEEIRGKLAHLEAVISALAEGR
jgi:hypothetical protein